jgi:hypothetical protein
MRNLLLSLLSTTTAIRLGGILLLASALVMALASMHVVPSRAASCSAWYQCPVTQRYGVNMEHGADLWTQGLPVTALRSGTVTFVGRECWEYPCVWDITWRLDFPSHAGGSPYMYVQIASAEVHVGQHVADWTYLGQSGTFIEIGLTPDWAYGVSNWRWGINILNVFPWL